MYLTKTAFVSSVFGGRSDSTLVFPQTVVAPGISRRKRGMAVIESDITFGNIVIIIIKRLWVLRKAL